MSEGIWTMPLVTAGAGAFSKLADQFQRSTSGAAAGLAGISVSTKPGRFYTAALQNGGATAYFFQVFDKATAPINTDVPILSRRLPASGEVLVDVVNINGLICLFGIGIAISSTPGVLTLALAADISWRRITFTASQ